MSSYAQWLASAEVRRATWVCGDQPVLVQEVLDTIRRRLNPGELDYVSLSAGPDFEREVWATANQYPLSPGNTRMILIHDADKLKRWEQLQLWLTRTRQNPGVHLVFVSDEHDLPHTTVAGRKVLKPHVAALKAPRGSLVRCSMPAEADAVAWVRRRAQVDENTARHLLTRTGGNLSDAAAVCAKLSLFSGTAASSTVDLLCAERPGSTFTDNLLALDKRRALLNIPDLDHGARLGMTAVLDNRLDLLARLHRDQVAGLSAREIVGVNPFLIRQYMPIARHYDHAHCVRRRRVLALVDDALRSGARDGVIEALVNLW